jgi:uncharacterized protein
VKPAPPQRILTLDIVRGVAVMGILAMNIVDFAMPPQAYVNPAAYGTESAADRIVWLLGFIFIDGKMRGLFSFLFGASMLLVIDRAEAKGASGSAVHYRRMAWLALFGLVHFYFVWHGDILFGYAIAGMIAWFFHQLEPKALIRIGIALVLVQFLIFASVALGALAATAPGATAPAGADWKDLTQMFAMPTQVQIAQSLALFRGGYGGIFGHRLAEQWNEPFVGTLMFGWETVGYMLFGMAALKSGFLSGEWAPVSYRRTALTCFAIGIPLYAALAWGVTQYGGKAAILFGLWGALPVLIRPPMILGTAALIILATRRRTALVVRIAAAGRAAFTNYLGTSIAMTTLFFGYGFGLYGNLGRAGLWLVILPMWAAMLLWSKPWLDRFRYGPFEWVWRSLARWSLQPMKRG